MTTIVIDQVQLQLTTNQLANALRQLSPSELEGVLRELGLATWEQRFDSLVARVRERAAQEPMSDEEIDAEVKAGRAEHYSSRS